MRHARIPRNVPGLPSTSAGNLGEHRAGSRCAEAGLSHRGRRPSEHGATEPRLLAARYQVTRSRNIPAALLASLARPVLRLFTFLMLTSRRIFRRRIPEISPLRGGFPAGTPAHCSEFNPTTFAYSWLNSPPRDNRASLEPLALQDVDGPAADRGCTERET